MSDRSASGPSNPADAEGFRENAWPLSGRVRPTAVLSWFNFAFRIVVTEPLHCGAGRHGRGAALHHSGRPNLLRAGRSNELPLAQEVEGRIPRDPRVIPFFVPAPASRVSLANWLISLVAGFGQLAFDRGLCENVSDGSG